MKKLLRLWPILTIFIVWGVLFSPVFSKKLLPIPSDIITGVYYPWLDYKWGFSVGVPVKNPLIADIPSILYPWRSFAIDELKSGRWPLWNPYYFTGMPLLANFQSAVFSYVNLFFLFFSKPIAWSLGIMTSPLLTMLAMFIYLKHKKLDQLSCLLGSVVFGLSGFEIAWMEYNVHGHTALFLPLLLLVIDYFFEEKKWSLFLVPFFVAFQIFSGYIPLVIYTYVICLFYILFFYFFPQVKQKHIEWKKYLFLLSFWIIGLGISAIQLVPGYELTSLSIRKTDPIVAGSNASYLPLKNIITMLAPDFFGNPATGNYFGTAFYDNFYFFVGTGTLIFILFSLFFIKKKKTVFFWWGMLFFSFLLCFRNPIGLFLEKILFLSGGVASRALFITDFSLAILAAEGFSFLFTSWKNKKKKIFLSLFVVLIFFLASFIFARQLNEANRTISIRNLMIPFLSWLSCSFFLIIYLKFPKFKFVRFFIFIIITSQLLYSAKKYLPFSKQEWLFPTTPVIDFLKQKQSESPEPFRVELGNVIPQNFLMPYGIETTSGSDALLPRKTAEFLSTLERGKVDERISRVHLISNYDSPLFGFTNTKYILTKKMDKEGKYSSAGKPPDKFLNSRYTLVFEDKTVQIYEDKKYQTRVTTSSLFENEVVWEEYWQGRLGFRTFFEEPEMVTVSNSIFPGWKAYLDGGETALIASDLPFFKIAVPKGEHKIDFKYEPDSFKWGMFLSFLSLSVLVFFLVLTVFKQKIFFNKQ